jgi:hypothetical protein
VSGNVAWIVWFVWVILVLGVTAKAAATWRETDHHGAIVFLAAIFYLTLAGIAFLLALL